MQALSLRLASRAISRGDMSPLDLANLSIERTLRLDPEIHAFAILDVADVLSQARGLTEEIPSSGRRSALHGIPIGVKDLIDVSGLRTAAGSRVLAGAGKAVRDAAVVASLRSAGALVMGKTHTHEFGFGVTTPGTRNPWDPSRIPGGSSGGSAAATAARLCLGSLGTDTAGSVRIPGALCGIAGLRPRRRVISMEGIQALAPSLDTWGLLAPDARDLALLWEILSGAGEERLQQSTLRVAAPALPGLLDCDPDVEAAVESAIDRLCETGARRMVARLPPFRDWDRPAGLLLMAEALRVHRGAGWFPERADAYTQQTLESLRYAETITGADLANAHASLHELAAAWHMALEDCDIVALPTCPIPAPLADGDLGTSREDRELLLTLTRPCIPANVCDLAAVTVPCGFTRQALPIGLQLIAREERTVLAAAIAFQDRTDHHSREPFPSSAPRGL